MVKKKEKGVTLVEVVVAMALIAIVSSAIFVTANFSISSQKKNQRNQFFINETENVLMCYYTGNFNQALRFFTGDNELEVDDVSKNFTLYYTEDFEYTNEENAFYSLEINYLDEHEFSPVITCKTADNQIFYSYGGAEDA